MVVGNSTVWIWASRRVLNSWLRLNSFSSICSLGSSAHHSIACHNHHCIAYVWRLAAGENVQNSLIWDA